MTGAISGASMGYGFMNLIRFQVSFEASTEQRRILPALGLFKDLAEAETFARSWLATCAGDLTAKIAERSDGLGFRLLRVLAKDARGEIVEQWPAGRLG